MKYKIPFGYTKRGTVRFYGLMCWLGVCGFTRPIRFKLIKHNKEIVFNHFNEGLYCEKHKQLGQQVQKSNLDKEMWAERSELFREKASRRPYVCF